MTSEKTFLICLYLETSTVPKEEGGTTNGDPLRGMAAHVAQLEAILSNQVKETQYLRRMIENFHFAREKGMSNHIALECQHYQSIRNNTQNILKKIFQMNILTESKRDLMSNVMSTDDPDLIELFSTFIFKCFTLRD